MSRPADVIPGYDEKNFKYERGICAASGAKATSIATTVLAAVTIATLIAFKWTRASKLSARWKWLAWFVDLLFAGARFGVSGWAIRCAGEEQHKHQWLEWSMQGLFVFVAAAVAAEPLWALSREERRLELEPVLPVVEPPRELEPRDDPGSEGNWNPESSIAAAKTLALPESLRKRNRNTESDANGSN